MQKRILSWVLALSLIATMFSCLGFSAFADETAANYTVSSINNYYAYNDPTSDVEGYRQLNIESVPSAATGAGFTQSLSIGGNGDKLKEATVFPSDDYSFKYITKGNFNAQNLNFNVFINSSKDTVYGRASVDNESYGIKAGDFFVKKKGEDPVKTDETEETAQHALSLWYDMGSAATVYDFVLGSQGNNGANAWLVTGYYSLYAANDKADLYKESSKVFTYNNSQKQAIQSFRFEQGVTARYFALVIWNPLDAEEMYKDGRMEDYVAQPRICMLKLFGVQKEMPYTVKEDTPGQNDASMFNGVDLNNIMPASAILSAWSANPEGFNTAQYAAGSIGFLNNGTISGEFIAGNSGNNRLFANNARDKAYTSEDKAYFEIRYDLGKAKDIANILVINHKDKSLMTGYYQIFVGNDLETMFDEPLYTMKNYTTQQQRQLLTAKSQGSLNARYVAMRIYDPYSVETADGQIANYENRYIRLLEFAVYGYVAEENNFTVSSAINGDIYSYQGNVKIAESLIGDKNPVKTLYLNKYKGVNEPKEGLNLGCGDPDTVTLRTLTTTKGVNGNITVGGDQLNFAKRPSEGSDAVSGLYDDETMQYGDIYYDLGGVADVNKIAFYGHTSTSYTVYHFKVSLANNVDDLFTDNAVCNSIDLYNTSNYAIINTKEVVRAKYIGFRIICGLTPSCTGVYNNGDYARMCHLDVFGNRIETKKVTFLDNMGKTFKEYDVVTGATLTEAEINAAVAAVPEVYGYNFTGNWSTDITGAITDDITVTPIYEKDTATTYTVKVTLTDGSSETLTKNFDDRLELTDNGATYFKTADGAILGVGKRVAVYVCGDMDIVASAEAAPTAPVVSITGATKSLSNSKNALNVFVHAVAGDKEIAEIGTIFISGTIYNTVKDTDWTKDTLAEAEKAFANAKSTKGYSNFMGRLLNITTEKKVTRVAKAYVTFSDGTTVYSDAKVVVFGE